MDLDGAVSGAPRSVEAIAQIRAAVKCEIDVSGGLRTIESVRMAFTSGADRVSIGSAALLNPELLRSACAEFPGRVFGSLDIRDGRLAVKGWVETSQLTVIEAAERFRVGGSCGRNRDRHCARRRSSGCGRVRGWKTSPRQFVSR